MNTYLIEANLKFPSCFHKGYEFTIYAKTRKEAIRQARRQVQLEGHTRQDGGIKYKATKQS